MKNKFLYIIFILLAILNAQNRYPIVLIHGFMGWGNSEMGSYNYWGGHKDFIDTLKNNGNIVFELSVGPVSSNWERAVEAYYQLKYLEKNKLRYNNTQFYYITKN